jgi:hypothetical protein
MSMNEKKIKLQQQIELAKKKLRAFEFTENQKIRKSRNEKLYTTGGIFDMVNPSLVIRKNTKQNPYTLTDNVHYRRLVGLAVSLDKIITEDNQEKLLQLDKIGADYLNNLKETNE